MKTAIRVMNFRRLWLLTSGHADLLLAQILLGVAWIMDCLASLLKRMIKAENSPESTATSYRVPDSLADRLPAFSNDDLTALEKVGEPSREMIVQELLASIETWSEPPSIEPHAARNTRCLIEAIKLIEGRVAA